MCDRLSRWGTPSRQMPRTLTLKRLRKLICCKVCPRKGDRGDRPTSANSISVETRLAVGGRIGEEERAATVAVPTEFGRVPGKLNGVLGRHHYNLCYIGLFAGGGVKGGRIIGKTDAAGMAGYPGCAHIPDRVDGQPKDFSAVIARARTCGAPTQLEEGELTAGFAHNQVMALAVIPIHTATKNRFCFKTPRPKPTPSASMLVATDSITRLKPLVGSGHSVSSSAGIAPWRTIRAPINKSRPNAIQEPQVSAQARI